MDQELTLRLLMGPIIVVECGSCGVYTELDRERTVRCFKASAPMSRVRRVIVGACDRMCVCGVDKCEASLRSEDASRT
ncbi:hypothetical protein QE369_004433 [Agrobacterium larrymoorei]|uniref:Uncharacterized protein n=1 Tax=Agrobacterium larrymoorei TaxID=160699 RepID=A0AAJ2BD42_9HYPH|nr:hypothetical protein [Agrobacterium larrymoorei]